ncbi:MAG: MFS transporter, partial [Chloroflexi bacterium]|nr:MFS transporter [Chloroflexota bacterium]
MIDRPAAAGRFTTFASLRHRDFRLLWLGLTISGAGSAMQSLGIGWLVIQLAVREGVPHLAPFYLGLIGLARGAPSVVFVLYGGVLSDRMNRRKLLMVTRSAAAVIAAVLAALTISNLITLWMLMLLSVLSSFDLSLDNPTRQAITPQLVPQRDLMSAVGLNQSTLHVAALAGPLIGGLLIVPFDVGGLMAANALGYVAAVALLLAMRPLPDPPPARHPGPLRALGEGLAFIRQDAALRLIVGVSLLAAFLVRPVNAMVPAIAYQTLGLGALELSWLLAAGGLGALAGSITLATIRPADPARLFVVVTVGWGCAVVLLAAQTALPGAMLSLALMHASQVLFGGIGFVQIQVRAPDRLRGRVISIFNSTNATGGFAALGQVAVGALASSISLALSVSAGGVLLVLLGAVVLRGTASWR